MTDVYLFGMNSLASILVNYLKYDDRYSLVGITANKKYCETAECFGYQLVPFEELPSKTSNFGIVNCVGYSRRMESREYTSLMIAKKKIALLSYVHPTAIVAGVEIDEGSIIMNRVVVEPYSRIGKGNVLYGGSYICHNAAIGDYNWVSAGCVLAGNVTIGNRNFLGINVSVRDCLKMGSMSIIGAGTVLVKDVPDAVTVIGNPPRVIQE